MSVGLDLVTTPTSLIFHRELTPSPPAIPLMIDGARVLAQLFAFLLPASLFVHTLCLAVSCPAVGMVFMLGTFFVIHIAETCHMSRFLATLVGKSTSSSGTCLVLDEPVGSWVSRKTQIKKI